MVPLASQCSVSPTCALDWAPLFFTRCRSVKNNFPKKLRNSKLFTGKVCKKTLISLKMVALIWLMLEVIWELKIIRHLKKYHHKTTLKKVGRKNLFWLNQPREDSGISGCMRLNSTFLALSTCLQEWPWIQRRPWCHCIWQRAPVSKKCPEKVSRPRSLWFPSVPTLFHCCSLNTDRLNWLKECATDWFL